MFLLALIGVGMTLLGPTLVISLALALDGSLGDSIVLFLAWATFAITLGGLALEGAASWGERRNFQTTWRMAAASGASLLIILIGLAVSLTLIPGLFTWFGLLLIFAMAGFAFALWSAGMR